MTDLPHWVPDTSSLASSAASLMAAIDASGGNPHYPHGGTPFMEGLWHVCRHLLDKVTVGQTVSLAEALEKIGHKRLVAPDMVIDLSERLEQAGQPRLPDFKNKSSIRDQAIFNMGLDAAAEALAPDESFFE